MSLVNEWPDDNVDNADHNADGTSTQRTAFRNAEVYSGVLKSPDGLNAVGAQLGRYELRNMLGRGATGVVYEARDTASDAIVAVKTVVSMDGENLFRLKHEFRSLANLEHENLVRFGELECDQGQWFFTMERVYGTDFLVYVRTGHPERDSMPPPCASSTRLRVLPSFTHEREQPPRELGSERRLREALAQLVEGLAALHEAGRIHRDIKPSNVLVTLKGRVVILDFGLMTGFGPDGRIVGTPAYMAPEQIACQRLTPAADWYAVGVMLFASLTGRLPFRGEVLLTKLTEDAPTDLGKDAPEDLRALCLDLLARDPNARPGVDEIRSRLGIAAPSKSPTREVFVGRQEELGRLRRALAEVPAADARSILVRGEPGMGKSMLVERFLSELPAQTLVLRGRCYEQESVPFGGADSLVDALSEYLIGLDPSESVHLFAGGVSNVARVFPVLCRVPIIAQQHVEGPVLNATTLRELAFGELARVVTALARWRPLVVYVDDLQWMDQDSVALIRQAILSSGTPCLFVATIRSCSDLPTELAELVARLDCIELRGLSEDDSRALWDTLGRTDEPEVRDAAVRQADGHPLLLSELLRSAQSGHLARHASARLLDVLWDRISQRDPIERRFLEMVSLAGAPTDYSVLARAAGLDVGECFTRLAALRAAQLVRVSRVGGERRVEPYHDRIREAILARIGDERGGRSAKLHLQLGRAVLAATARAALPARIFTIAAHMNLGMVHLESPYERKRLAEINLIASRQALIATAFERAWQFATTGLECLGPHEQGAWSAAGARTPDLCRELHLARLQGEYRTGQRDRALATFDALKQNVRDTVERAEIFVTWIGLESANALTEAAVDAGREILGELGASLPPQLTRIHVLAEYAATRRAQRGRSAEQLRFLPKLCDARMRSVLRILVALAPAAAFHANGNLLPWIMMRIAHLSMELGLSETSPYGFAGYGMVLAGAFGKFEEAAAFGALAVDLADAGKNPRIIAKTHFLNAGFILPWVEGFDRSREALDEASELARLYADTEYQMYSRALVVHLGVGMGTDVQVAQQWAERGRGVAALCSANGMVARMEVVLRYAAALRGETPSLVDLSSPESSHADFVASLGGELATMYVSLALAELAYLADDLPRAEAHVAEMHRRIHAAFAKPELADIWFTSALVAARGCDGATAEGRAERLVQVGRASRKLDAWARSCPANFEPHAAIVRAELLRLAAPAPIAAAAYETAIAAARRHGQPKREAIACELAERHARTMGDALAARQYRRAAVDAYRRWGATAKAEMLASPR
jgi:predicted ATPase